MFGNVERPRVFMDQMRDFGIVETAQHNWGADKMEFMVYAFAGQGYTLRKWRCHCFLADRQAGPVEFMEKVRAYEYQCDH